MLVLVTYDVETSTPEGRRRLRKVSKLCTDKGIRVQNSVFECIVDASEYAKLKAKIASTVDPSKDSVRFYLLGSKADRRVEKIGVEPQFSMDGLLVF